MAQQEGRKEGRKGSGESIHPVGLFLSDALESVPALPHEPQVDLHLADAVYARHSQRNISIAGTGFHQISPHGTAAPLPLLRETTYTLAPAATQ